MAKKGCCCWFLIHLLQTIIIISLATFIFWLTVRPKRIKVDVTNVTLSQFNLTANNILYYNLTMNITIRNPNKKIGIYYDRIEASAFYEMKRFDTVMLTPFYQGHKTTSYLRPVFEGQHLVVLGAKDSSEFNKEKSSGVYSFDVILYLRVRVKLGKIKVRLIKPTIGCELKVPLASANGTSAGGTEVNCDALF